MGNPEPLHRLPDLPAGNAGRSAVLPAHLPEDLHRSSGAAVWHEPEQSQPVVLLPALLAALRGLGDAPARSLTALAHRLAVSEAPLAPLQEPAPAPVSASKAGRAPPLYGALDVKRFPSRFSDIAYPYVRSTGPSLRPDHERGGTRGWAEVKDGPQGHRRRRRPASLRSAHPRVTLGGLGSDDWPVGQTFQGGVPASVDRRSI